MRLRLRADVPVGAYLSGGLDSSTVVAMIRRQRSAPLKTFSIRFEDAEFDEGSYQRALVESLGVDHTEMYISAADIAAAFPRTVWHMESPVLRTAPTPLLLLASCARAEGYKVVLTGEGADEVLAGYDLFKEGRIRRFWARDPQSRMRPALLGRLYPYLRHSPTAAPAYARRFFGTGLDRVERPGFAHLPRWQSTRRLFQFLSADMRAVVRDFDPCTRLEALLPSAIGAWPPLAQDQYIEAVTLLSGYLLCSQGDRVSLANSIEGRFPFLDHRVVEFCNRLPVRYKLMGLQEKYLLKRAMEGLVPDVIRLRAKQPYRAPDSRSFFLGHRSPDYVDDLLSPKRLRDAGYFDAKAVQGLLEKCRQGRVIGFGDNMSFIGICSTMLVHELFVRGASVTDAGLAQTGRIAVGSGA